MKLTPNAAMRARDVSRPRAEHLAEAEAAEASPPGISRERTDGTEAGALAGDERTGQPGLPRRRRGPRDVARRSRWSR